MRELADSLNVSVDFLLYEEVPTIRTRNIEALLRNKPELFIISMEKLIRLCSDEFVSDSDGNGLPQKTLHIEGW